MSRWLLLVYRLPAQPSAPRVATWRALKRLGGSYLQDGAYALPHTEPDELELRNLAHDIGNYGGSAVVLRAEVAAGEGALRSMLAAASAARLPRAAGAAKLKPGAATRRGPAPVRARRRRS